MAGREDSGTFKFLVEDIRGRGDRGSTQVDDYRYQRRTLLEAVEAGRKVEDRVDLIERRERTYVKQREIEGLLARVATLEAQVLDLQRTKRRLFDGVGGTVKAILASAATALITYLLSRHKGP